MKPIPIEQWPGMRVLTVREPWASLIISGQKDVENRSRTNNHRGPMLIQASATVNRAEYDAALAWIARHVVLDRQTPVEWFPSFEACRCAAGKIIGGCTLTGSSRCSGSPWFDGAGFALSLAGAWAAETPVPFKGQLSMGTYRETP